MPAGCPGVPAVPKGWGRNQICILSLLSGQILIRRHVFLSTAEGIRGSSPGALGPVSLFAPPGCIKEPRSGLAARCCGAEPRAVGAHRVSSAAGMLPAAPSSLFLSEMDGFEGFEIHKLLCGRGAHLIPCLSFPIGSRGRARCPQDPEGACEVRWEPRDGASGVPADDWASKTKPQWPCCENQRGFKGWISPLQRPAGALRIIHD